MLHQTCKWTSTWPMKLGSQTYSCALQPFHLTVQLLKTSLVPWAPYENGSSKDPRRHCHVPLLHELYAQTEFVYKLLLLGVH